MNRVILAMLVVILGLNIFMVVDQQKKLAGSLLMPEIEVVEVIDSSHCVDLNEEETLQCLENVIAQGNYTGNDLFVLGQLYLYGFGTEANGEKAVKALERAAFEFDNVDAMILLGNLFVDNDRLAGKYWYSQASQKGSLEGQLRLANIYRYSEADQNLALALNLYQAAANQGSAQAQYELALIYAMGIGVDPNIDHAVQILESTCDQKHENSCVLLNRIKELQAESN